MGLIRIHETAAELARSAAEVIAGRAATGLMRSGGFRLAVSGGRTPVETYRMLATHHREAADWARITLLFADERDAPPTEPESNYWEVRKLLVEPIGIPPERVHRMKADAPDLEAAARAYEPQLLEPLDLLVLGIGEDGHTASLFPGSPLLRETGRRVAAVHDSPKPPPRRMTITPRVIHEAREVLVLASGEGKAEAVARALQSAAKPIEVPARLAAHGAWYLDAAAARGLSSRT